MPLTFRSRSHGIIAFGFFNIEIDMLLLEQLFFFAEPFCQAVVDLLAPVAPGTAEVAAFTFAEPAFLELVTYVDRGGYPRWERGVRPPYVCAMMERLDPP